MGPCAQGGSAPRGASALPLGSAFHTRAHTLTHTLSHTQTFSHTHTHTHALAPCANLIDQMECTIPRSELYSACLACPNAPILFLNFAKPLYLKNKSSVEYIPLAWQNSKSESECLGHVVVARHALHVKHQLEKLSLIHI